MSYTNESEWVANLGDRAKDKITGFTGIIVAQTKWLNGCMRLTIEPEQLKDGKPIDPHSFDQDQVEVVSPEAMPMPPKKTGGPMPDVQRNADPT